MPDITSIIEDAPENNSITDLGPEVPSDTSLEEKPAEIINGPKEFHHEHPKKTSEKIPSIAFPEEPAEQPSTGNNIKDLTNIPEEIDALTTPHKPTDEADEIENKFITNVQNEQVKRIF